MYAQVEKSKENTSRPVTSLADRKNGNHAQGFVDNRPEANEHRETQEMAGNSPQVKQFTQLQAVAVNCSAPHKQPIQKKENHTGLPDDIQTGTANAIGSSIVTQRLITGKSGEILSFGDILEHINQDPSAVIANEDARRKLMEMLSDKQTEYSIHDIIDALGGGPKTLKRQDRDFAVFHPPLEENTLNLGQISGTHGAVAKTFTDGKPIDGMVKSLIENPNLLTTEANFVLTVFRATPPGHPDGPTKIWSMNNRRLKAMQLAAKVVHLPNVKVRWASKDEVEYASQPGKWQNLQGGEVDFHSAGSQARRLAEIVENRPKSESATAEQVENAMDDPEALAKLLDL